MSSEPPTTESPSTFRYVLGFLAVGVAWGFTTPFMRRAALNYTPKSRPILQDKSISAFQRTLLGIWYSIVDLLSRPNYLIPLALNLSGSVWFFLLVGQAGMFIGGSWHSLQRPRLMHCCACRERKMQLLIRDCRAEFVRSNHKFLRLFVHCVGGMVGGGKDHHQRYAPILAVYPLRQFLRSNMTNPCRNLARYDAGARRYRTMCPIETQRRLTVKCSIYSTKKTEATSITSPFSKWIHQRYSSSF